MSFCEMPVHRRGFCSKHYKADKAGVDPETVVVKKRYSREGPCIVDGCGRDRQAQGLCPRHYELSRQGLDPHAATIATYQSREGSCSVDGCSDVVFANRMCQRHNHRDYVSGDAGPANYERVPGGASLEDLFAKWEGEAVRTPNGCLIHPSLPQAPPRHKDEDVGYTIVSFRSGEDVMQRHLHRVAWEMSHGDVPDGLVVRHMCDVAPCFAVEHMVLGTHAQNMADMVQRGRNENSRIPEEKRELIRSLVEQGSTVKDIAKIAHVHYDTARKYWQEFGGTPNYDHRLTDAGREARRLLSEGVPAPEVVEMTGLHPSTVYEHRANLKERA